MNTNLYWPVYKNLEVEIITLSNQIHFSDDQLNIYSIKIAELILRTCVEVESISKALYFSYGGKKPDDNDLFYDTDCLEYLESKFILSKKNVLVSASSFYLEELVNKVLTPLYKANKRGSSQTKWQQAYQAIKHNRVTSLKKAKLGHLINSAAALYILNVYYQDNIYDLEKNSIGSNFDKSLGSSIYSVKTHIGSLSTDSEYVKQSDFEECVYLIKHKDESRLAINSKLATMNSERNNLAIKGLSGTDLAFLQNVEAGKEREEILKKYDELQKDSFYQIYNLHGNELAKLIQNSEYEAVLNKNQY